MIKNKIKFVKKGIIETNSSSSHSLTIGIGNLIKPGDKEWDINIKNRVLYIPTCDSFGWEYFKFNSCQRKLQYLSGLFFYDGDISISSQKEIKKLKSLLCKVFDIDDVIFEWVEKYKEKDFKRDLIEGFNPEYTSFSPITVDHESRDLKKEIIESEDTLKSFLLSRDSWVFGGNDSADVPQGFYKEEKQNILNATASVDFPGLGRVDFRIYYPDNINKYITENRSMYSIYLNNNIENTNDILKYFIYDVDKKIVYPTYYIKEKDVKKLNYNNYMEYRKVISYKGDYYCLFTQSYDETVFPLLNTTNWNKVSNDVNEKIDIFKKDTSFKNMSDNTALIIESGKVKEDVDYKLFKIKIKQDEF